MLGLKFFIEIKGSSFSVVTHVSSTLNGTCPHKREAWLKGEKAPLLLQYCTIFLAVPFFAVGRHPFLKSDIYGTKASTSAGREESFLHVYSLVIDSKRSLKIL